MSPTAHPDGDISAEPKPGPCPFCGSTDEPDIMGSLHDTERWVECTDCLAHGPVATIGCRDEDEETVDLDAEAVELWNLRRVRHVGVGSKASA